MSKKQIFYLGLFASITLLSSGFKPFEMPFYTWFHTKPTEKILFHVPTRAELDFTFLTTPFTGKTFVGFQQNLAARESEAKYHKVNTLGYLGKYQFGAETLKVLGITNTDYFLQSRKLQEAAFLANLARNKWELRKYITKYANKTINGIEITESGILAAAHLGGTGSVKKFFKSNGTRKFKDGYGTSICEYLTTFAGYNVSQIEADKNAKAKDFI